jgi:hypothetical protein
MIAWLVPAVSLYVQNFSINVKRQRTNALRAMDLDLGLLLESAPSATGHAQMQQLQKGGGTTHAD